MLNALLPDKSITENSRLCIGPWIGEFGIEVMRWQGFARSFAQSREWSEVIVSSRPESEFFYRDFATEFVPYQSMSPHTLGFTNKQENLKNDFARRFFNLKQTDVWLSPEEFTDSIQRYALPAACSIFRDFSESATPTDSGFDILIHARATSKSRQEYKNWEISKWTALVDVLSHQYSIASVGTKPGAHKIASTTDLRGIPLDELAGYCKNAILMIGPSSGPLHFALHCKTPVVTWMEESFENYSKTWNPFESPLCRLTVWNPAAELVLLKAVDLIRIIQSKKHRVHSIVFGTKRSGHHGILEWVTSLFPETRLHHWNDCITGNLVTHPVEPFVLPLSASYPKVVNETGTTPCVYEYNDPGSQNERLLSFEGVPIERLNEIPEVRDAKRLIFVLRDAANFVSSLAQGLAGFRGKPFTHSNFQEVIRIYDGYLNEALGLSRHLGNLRSKTHFVSYNRWMDDPKYRSELIESLGSQENKTDLESLVVSQYGPGSSFQNRGTAVKDLKTLYRWEHYKNNNSFWDLVVNPSRAEKETKFHGPLPYLKLP